MIFYDRSYRRQREILPFEWWAEFQNRLHREVEIPRDNFPAWPCWSEEFAPSQSFGFENFLKNFFKNCFFALLRLLGTRNFSLKKIKRRLLTFGRINLKICVQSLNWSGWGIYLKLLFLSNSRPPANHSKRNKMTKLTCMSPKLSNIFNNYTICNR